MAAFSSYNQHQSPVLFDSVPLQQSNNAAMECSSVTDKYESLSDHRQAAVTSMVELDKKNKRKRKPITSSSNSAQSKDMREMKKNKSSEDDQKGYIHVRAKRGQATDSHSLAERVRREKISDRMRALQALVPGCDKVTGKAPMLDEIINYVQSLQNQVEFLSMKLSSVNPMSYDFVTDLDAFGLQPNESLNSLASQLPTVQECNTTQPSVIHETSNILMSPNANANGYSLVDNSSNFPFLFQQAHLLNNLHQENGQLLWDVDDQKQKFINETGFSNNLRSFH